MTAFKKPLCSLMALIMVFAFIAAAPISVYAEEETTYSALEIELNKEVEENFEYIKVEMGSAIQIVGYTGNEKEVTVPKKIGNLSVISIGAGAFEGNTTMEKVELNTNITVIGDNAFKGCTALKELDGISAIEKLGASAFEGCTSLESFKVPDNLTEIPARCFADCTALTEVDEHKNMKSVEKDSFVGSAWENAMPDGPLSLGRILYSYKGAVKDIVIPEGVSIIEDYAFLGCESIETLELGYDVEEIGLYAFQNCVNLKSVKVNDAMGLVSAGAFKGCSSLESIDFSESTLAMVGYEAFADCTSLKEIKLAETLSEVADYAFANTQISTIDFGKNVNTVGSHSFLNASKLESITVTDKNKNYSAVDGVLYNKNGTELIVFPAAKTGTFELPQAVEKICDNAFYGSAISAVKLAEESALREIGISAFENSVITEFTIPANVSKLNNATFKNAAKLAKLTIEEGLTYVGAFAFEGCASLVDVTLPASVYTVANGAFKNTGLKSVNVGDGVAELAAEAFAGNKALAKVTLGKNVEKIGVDAFKDCALLKAINLGASVKDFNAASFSGCTALATITVDKDNKNIKAIDNVVYCVDGDHLIMVAAGATTVAVAEGTKYVTAGAFDLAKNVAAITFPATLVNVEADALDGTAWFAAQNGVVYAGPVLYKVKGEVADVVVAEGTTAIADGAVKNAAVKTVTLPATLVTIGINAFEGAGIVEVAIPASVTSIGIGAFKDCKVLSKATLSKGIDVINTAVFSGCAALSEIAIPESVKVISADAFANCIALTKVSMPAVEKIEKYAFSGCIALGSIELPATLTEFDALSFYGCTALQGIGVNAANKAFKSLGGIVLVANDDGEFNTIALYPAGKAGAYAVP
ncbi:MAG: leucine-rich repeat domain-containing protein [Clostridia bacterium]|nr:leucine-rich repeat domain-containing protein [Clostridia bacterium]